MSLTASSGVRPCAAARVAQRPGSAVRPSFANSFVQRRQVWLVAVDCCLRVMVSSFHSSHLIAWSLLLRRFSPAPIFAHEFAISVLCTSDTCHAQLSSAGAWQGTQSDRIATYPQMQRAYTDGRLVSQVAARGLGDGLIGDVNDPEKTRANEKQKVCCAPPSFLALNCLSFN